MQRATKEHGQRNHKHKKRQRRPVAQIERAVLRSGQDEQQRDQRDRGERQQA
jgi:hypothetical protein